MAIESIDCVHVNPIGYTGLYVFCEMGFMEIILFALVSLPFKKVNIDV